MKEVEFYDTNGEAILISLKQQGPNEREYKQVYAIGWSEVLSGPNIVLQDLLPQRSIAIVIRGGHLATIKVNEINSLISALERLRDEIT